MGFPGGESGKDPACQCRGHKRSGSIPGLGRSPGVGTPSSIQCAFTNPILLTPLLFPFGDCVCFLCLWVCFSFINKFIGTIFLYWCKGLTHWKRLWCWERLKTGGEGDNRGLDGWRASPTWWTWVCTSPGNCWWTRKSGMLQSVGLQKELDMTERLNWLTGSFSDEENWQRLRNLLWVTQTRMWYRLHFLLKKYLLIWLHQVLGVTRGIFIFTVAMLTLSCEACGI